MSLAAGEAKYINGQVWITKDPSSQLKNRAVNHRGLFCRSGFRIHDALCTPHKFSGRNISRALNEAESSRALLSQLRT